MAVTPNLKGEKKYIVMLDDDNNVFVSWHGHADESLSCLEYDSEQQCMDAHPVLVADNQALGEAVRKTEIDKDSLLDINKMHLAKAWEADRIVYDNVTDPERVPILSGEAAELDIPLLDLATTVLGLHKAEGKADNARIAAKQLNE